MKRVWLHVGLPKSGTSYLQRLMVANKDALATEAGVLFPGDGWKQQVAAVRDVRNLGDAPATRGAWDRLVAECLAWDGDAVVSMEWLAPARPKQIRRMVSSFAPHPVEVVFTARDLGRTIPAAWQEFMQNGQSFTWERFLADIRHPERLSTDIGTMFWRQQDLPELAAAWVAEVGAAQVHVVTLPPPGAPRDLLWRRFAQVLGIDPGVGDPEVSNGNESLGVESAELMRRLNELAAAAGVDKRTYTNAFKHRLGKQVLAVRRRDESSLVLPDEFRPWASEAAAGQIDGIRRLGVPVVGDLAELTPHYPESAGRAPESVGDGELLQIALEALLEVAPQRRRKRD